MDGTMNLKSLLLCADEKIVRVLRRTLGDAWQIDSQLPVALDDLSEPEPDVFVVAKDPNDYREAHPSHPLLIIEVAESSYRIDHEYKASLYARASVPEYWIVDLVHEAVEIHREPVESQDARYGWRYRSVETLRPPGSTKVSPGFHSMRSAPHTVDPLPAITPATNVP